MTNQNVVVSDAKSGIGLALFSSAVAKPPPAAAQGGGFVAIPRKKPLKKLETGSGAARISAWVDSMRASSPTRKPLSESEDQIKSSWIKQLHHPSALTMFEQIINASSGKQIVMFLDYDGTLSPIVEDPDRAFMTKEMRKAVSDVARKVLPYSHSYREVYNFVKLSQLYYAGSHGMDIKGPAKDSNNREVNANANLNDNQGLSFQPAREFLPMIDKVYKVLLEKIKSTPGAKVENNKFCLSVHYRCVDEKSWNALAEQVKSVLNDYPKLKLTQGRKVLEIRPTIKWDKGKALEFLLESLGYANSDDVFPVYIGDDRTDEDAFKVLRDRGQGFGILVSKGPKETNASYSLQEPSEASYAFFATFGGMEKITATWTLEACR
ncbi:hypothetical protein TEA_007600 [Camellia sinensis var. sinensis]|uniref:Trehalose 6-phosphate phosphatase n=1 Tax=Camellia sinensis var. sinensis TaxID=542762 RepID=A0A4S4D5L7_CAMSN|nr:hypothetical protein TEA_007600 [Camellia sinensis var. sinensis]